MQASPTSQLKQKLKSGQQTYGFWVTLESPSIMEMVCRMGLDWVVVDAEHNHLDHKDIVEHLRIANLLNVPVFVHIAEIDAALIARMFDLGADGVFLPQVRSADDVRRAICFAKYPPLGERGMAAERSSRWGRRMSTYVPRANDEIMIIPMMETIEAADALDEILAVPGIDAFLFGPADFSSSSGYPGQWEGPGVADRITELLAKIQAAGLPCAVLSGTPEDAVRRKDQGFNMIGLGSDTGTLIGGLTNNMRGVGTTVAADAWD